MKKTIEQVMEYLGDENTLMAVSTVSENMPKVRFMSFKMVEDDKIYLITGKSKNIFKELEKNNNIEICSLPNSQNQWVRINGNVKFVRDLDLSKKAFKILPMLEMAYKTPENGDIALFYIENLKAIKYGMGMKPEEL